MTGISKQLQIVMLLAVRKLDWTGQQPIEAFLKGPFTLAIFAAISAAIFAAISRRLKLSPWNRQFLRWSLSYLFVLRYRQTHTDRQTERERERDES